jgi:hypothetical protein
MLKYQDKLVLQNKLLNMFILLDKRQKDQINRDKKKRIIHLKQF